MSNFFDYFFFVNFNKLFDFSLTGRPNAVNWPSGVSIDRETFLNRPPKEPRELCPQICEFSNDLLKVIKFKYNYQEKVISFFLFTANVSI